MSVLYSLFQFFIRQVYYFFQIFFDEKYIIITGHNACYFMGNNKYFFEYLAREERSFSYYFYTKCKKTYLELNSLYPGKILFGFQINSLVKILKAKIIFTSTGYFDLSPFPLPYNKKIINLWHGIPLKQIGFKINPTSSSLVKFSKALDFFCVSSDIESKVIQECFRIESQKVLVIGLPKNDYFFSKQESKPIQFFEKDFILYAPTFRDNGIGEREIEDLLPLDELNDFLIRNQLYFVYRNHVNTNCRKAFDKYDNIYSADMEDFPDTQLLLSKAKILVTDYSGIYLDYLLTDRPIVFYNYDFGIYQKQRGFLFDYLKYTPGFKVQSKNDLLRALEIYDKKPKLHEAEREYVKETFHFYRDGKSCDRIYDKTLEIID